LGNCGGTAAVKNETTKRGEGDGQKNTRTGSRRNTPQSRAVEHPIRKKTIAAGESCLRLKGEGNRGLLRVPGPGKVGNAVWSRALKREWGTNNRPIGTTKGLDRQRGSLTAIPRS